MDEGPSGATRAIVGGVQQGGSLTRWGAEDDDRKQQPSLGGLSGLQITGGIVVGVAGGTALAVAGTLIGASVASPCRGEWCQLAGAIPGFLLGESVGVATGAHIGAGRKGNLLHEILIASAISTAGVAAVASGHGSGIGPVMLGLVPIAQLAAVLALEAR